MPEGKGSRVIRDGRGESYGTNLIYILLESKREFVRRCGVYKLEVCQGMGTPAGVSFVTRNEARKGCASGSLGHSLSLCEGGERGCSEEPSL